MNLFLLMKLNPIIWVSKEINYETLNWQMFHIVILNIISEMFKPSKNPNLIIIEGVCVSNPKKWKNLQYWCES